MITINSNNVLDYFVRGRPCKKKVLCQESNGW